MILDLKAIETIYFDVSTAELLYKLVLDYLFHLGALVRVRHYHAGDECLPFLA